jgi:hypothetical protein
MIFVLNNYKNVLDLILDRNLSISTLCIANKNILEACYVDRIFYDFYLVY